MNEREKLSDDLLALLAGAADGSLTSEEAERLSAQLRESEIVRELYADFMMLQVQLELEHTPSVSGAALAAGETLAQRASEESIPHAPREEKHHAERDEYYSTPTRSVSEESTPHAPREAGHHAERDGYYPQSPFRISTLAAVVAFVAIGILTYAFWPGPAQQPVVKQIPAAKIANLMDAKWEAAFSPVGNRVLTTGQRLILQSGSAEITFNSQAKIIVDGPAEFTILDAAACRLADGKLVAHVPEPAKGFKVHTPSGTVTDLGTEFGVYVDTRADQQASREEEQQPGGGPQFDGKQPPITEVHVFTGKVEVARSEVGSRKSEGMAQNPTSDLRPPTILSAGQAVTISEKKVQPLPAADPFKFALDKLQGKPRTVLLSEDFESYDVGANQNSLGPWIFQGGTRKGQGISITDVAKDIADYRALGIISLPSFNPPPPSISRVLRFVPSAPNPPSSFPCLAHTITAPQLARTCRLLVEFVIYPSHGSLEPSFALATEAGPAPGIEFWRNADPAAPRTAWTPDRCYRTRVLMDVLDGKPREARVERALWSGPEGWVRDADYRTPVPQVDWTTPPKFVIFGYPTVSPETPTGLYSIDSIRIEVISEK